MKLKRIMLSALMVCALSIGSVGSAFADHSSASWNVDFNNNKQMVSDYDQSAINSKIAMMQPGDSLSLDVAIKNDSSETTEWYMTTSALKTLEEASEASGGAYTYELSYNGNEIYSSDTVGGDDSNGLKEVSNATGSWFYLGSLASGRGGNVTIDMALDGESQGNSYMDTLGRLQINFAVEDPAQPNRTIVGGDLPQTGDLFANVFMFVICALLVALTALSFYKDRTKAAAASASRAAHVNNRTTPNFRKGGDR